MINSLPHHTLERSRYTYEVIMHDSLLILGRQPALGLAELESLYGPEKLRAIGNEAALLAVDPSMVNFARIGGSIKLCEVLATFGATKWPELQKHLETTAMGLISATPSDGKVRFGLSAYGLSAKPQQLMAAGLTIKKSLRKDGHSVRLVPNQAPALNSAQVLHNHLTGEHGYEIVCVRDGSKVICARTIAEQDIESYTLRDRGRPKRDARVGMLPPKLAQIIINLAATDLPIGTSTILDPFCGTGVILQEAALMGFSVYGTDLDPRMIAYSKANLEWLRANEQATNLDTAPLEVGDATTHTWENPFDTIACETYLGQPFSSLPSPEKLEQVRATCNIVIEKFLANANEQMKPGSRICVAAPAWQLKPGQYIHLPLLDRLGKLGYNRIDFKHVRREDLVYSREGQIVARELLVLTRR
jgi:tRNA G10  N-methylase Trm11